MAVISALCLAVLTLKASPQSTKLWRVPSSLSALRRCELFWHSQRSSGAGEQRATTDGFCQLRALNTLCSVSRHHSGETESVSARR